MKLLFFSPLKGASYKTKASGCLLHSKDLSRLQRRLLGKERDTELYLIGRGRASFLCALTFLFPWHYLRDSTGTSGEPVQGYNLKNGETKSVEDRGWGCCSLQSLCWSGSLWVCSFLHINGLTDRMPEDLNYMSTICMSGLCSKEFGLDRREASFAFLLGGNSG